MGKESIMNLSNECQSQIAICGSFTKQNDDRACVTKNMLHLLNLIAFFDIISLVYADSVYP
jgi:hypothetical protein